MPPCLPEPSLNSHREFCKKGLIFLLPTEEEVLIILPGSDAARCQSLVLSLPQGCAFFYRLGQVLGEDLTEVGVFVQTDHASWAWDLPSVPLHEQFCLGLKRACQFLLHTFLWLLPFRRQRP